MKTTDPRDPLDRKIDALLAKQAVKASDDFASRALRAACPEPVERARPEPVERANEEASQNQSASSGSLAPILRFMLPLAAAVAVVFIAYMQFQSSPPQAPTEVTTQNQGTGDALNSFEVQELLMLQEGLSGFAQIESEDLSSDDLLNTLDTLYSI